MRPSPGRFVVAAVLLLLLLVLTCLNDVWFQKLVPLLINSSSTINSRRVKFVPYPYQNVRTGDEGAGCRWETRDIPNDRFEAFDPIQRAAFREGMCIPTFNKQVNLRVFSSKQAKECLSPAIQGRDIKVMIAGDSYNRQLFIGLADILLNRPSDVEIYNSTQRVGVMRRYNKEIRDRAQNDTSFPNVQFSCYKECYGKYDNYTMVHCSNCLNELVGDNPDAVPVLGAFVHINNRLKGKRTAVFNEMWELFENTKQLIFNSGPSYQVSKVPRQYQNASGEIFYNRLLPLMAPHDPQRPFLDFFQLTRSCHMENCSYDGGHRARYVNRWKAQLLLNMLCTIDYDEDQRDD